MKVKDILFILICFIFCLIFFSYNSVRLQSRNVSDVHHVKAEHPQLYDLLQRQNSTIFSLSYLVNSLRGREDSVDLSQQHVDGDLLRKEALVNTENADKDRIINSLQKDIDQLRGLLADAAVAKAQVDAKLLASPSQIAVSRPSVNAAAARTSNDVIGSSRETLS